MKNKFKTTLLIVLGVLIFNSTSLANIIYVDANNNIPFPSQTGETWSLAYKYLQDALSIAQEGDEIWITEGIYYPDRTAQFPGGTEDREASFTIEHSNITLYGGFLGGEKSPIQRDPNNKSHLSGEIKTPLFEDNSYNVVTISEYVTGILFDGFIITGGNSTNRGGGVVSLRDSESSFTNCIFTNNHAGYQGGGMSLTRTSSVHLTNCDFNLNTAYEGGGLLLLTTPIQYQIQEQSTIQNCTFTNNTAVDRGGAFSCLGSTNYPIFINNEFYDNHAAKGGAIYCTSSLNIKNSVFANNTASDMGGAITNLLYDALVPDKLSVTNCTFFGNDAIKGDAIACFSYSPSYLNRTSVANSILWDGGNNNEMWTEDGSTIDITYSDIRGPIFAGTGNINDNPEFVDAVQNDFHLKSIMGHWNTGFGTQWIIDNEHSPCIDKGDFSPFLNEPLPNGNIINMGAYGNTLEASKSDTRIIYVKQSAPNYGDGSSWASAYNDLEDALETATNGNQIWVAAGTYLPSVISSLNIHEQNAYGENVETYELHGSKERTDKYNWVTFRINNRISLYGGFVGNDETSISQRDWIQNPTILSGNVGNPNSTVDNCFRVVFVGGSSAAGTIIDGFTIADGNGDHGIGLLLLSGDFYINHCILKDNDCGLYNSGCENLYISDCLFKDNVSTTMSYGAITSYNSNVNITGSSFFNNESVCGGAIRFSFSTGNIYHSKFVGNHATYAGYQEGGGGGICINRSDLSIDFTTFYNNTCDRGTGNAIDNYPTSNPSSTCNITNSILWNYPDNNQQIPLGELITASYSDIITADGTIYPDENDSNINEDPIFVNPNTFDFHLASTEGYWDSENEQWLEHEEDSPCIDAGDDTPCVEPAPNGDRVNIGAYGNTDEASKSCSSRESSDLKNDEVAINNSPFDFNCKVGPNPFSQNLSIEIDISNDSYINISVFNMNGQKVKTITQSNYKAGSNTFSWTGKDEYSNLLPNGLYIVAVESNGYFQSEKVIFKN